MTLDEAIAVVEMMDVEGRQNVEAVRMVLNAARNRCVYEVQYGDQRVRMEAPTVEELERIRNPDVVRTAPPNGYASGFLDQQPLSPVTLKGRAKCDTPTIVTEAR